MRRILALLIAVTSLALFLYSSSSPVHNVPMAPTPSLQPASCDLPPSPSFLVLNAPLLAFQGQDGGELKMTPKVDYESFCFGADMFEQIKLSPEEKRLVNLIKGTNDTNLDVAGDLHSVTLKPGQTGYYGVRILPPKRGEVTGVTFILTTVPISGVPDIVNNYFKIKYVETVGGSAGNVEEGTTSGKAYQVISPAGDIWFFFAFTAVVKSGGIRTTIEPHFFGGPHITSVEPQFIQCCCEHVKTPLIKVPEPTICWWYGIPYISDLYVWWTKYALYCKAVKNTANVPCTHGEATGKDLVIKGDGFNRLRGRENDLPTLITITDDCGSVARVTEATIVSDTEIRAKIDITACRPGQKCVKISGVGGFGTVTFLKVVQDVPDTIVTQKRFTAVRIFGTQEKIPLTFTIDDGTNITFAQDQRYDVTCVTRSSGTMATATTTGGCNNIATTTIQGTCVPGEDNMRVTGPGIDCTAPIRNADINLTADIPEDKEITPGAYLCTGQTKPLTLDVSSPSTYSYKVTLSLKTTSGSSPVIQVFDNEGAPILTGDGTKVISEGKGSTDITRNLMVKGISSGTACLTATYCDGSGSKCDAINYNDVKIDFAIPSESEKGYVITDVIPASSPNPVVILKEVKKEDVTIDKQGNVSLVVSGTVTDPLADIVPGDAATISSISLKVNEKVTTLDVETQNASSSFWKPYSYQGVFSGKISFVAHEGRNIIDVKTSKNFAGNVGTDAFSVEVLRSCTETLTIPAVAPQPPVYIPPLLFSVEVSFSGNLSADVVDTISVKRLGETVATVFTETTADSKIFSQTSNPTSFSEIEVIGPGQFDPNSYDDVQVRLKEKGIDNYLSLYESGTTPLVFLFKENTYEMIRLQNPLDPNAPDTIYFSGTGIVGETAYVETGNDTKIFEQNTDSGLYSRISITAYSTPDGNVLDVITAKREKDFIVFSDEFTETSPGSLKFRKSDLVLPPIGLLDRSPGLYSGEMTIEQQFAYEVIEVVNHESSDAASFTPFVVICSPGVALGGERGYLESIPYDLTDFTLDTRYKVFSRNGVASVFSFVSDQTMGESANLFKIDKELTATVKGCRAVAAAAYLTASDEKTEVEPLPMYGFPGEVKRLKLKSSAIDSTGFGDGKGSVSFGDGIEVKINAWSSTEIDLNVTIARDAAAGSRNVVVTKAGGVAITMTGYFCVFHVVVVQVDFVEGENGITIYKNPERTKPPYTWDDKEYWGQEREKVEIEFDHTSTLQTKWFRYPAAYKRNTSIGKIIVGITVVPNPSKVERYKNGISFDLQGSFPTSKTTSITFVKGGITVKDAKSVIPGIELTTTDLLPNRVVKLADNIEWKISTPETVTAASMSPTGPHVIYVMFNKPITSFRYSKDDKPTPNRLDFIFMKLPAGGLADDDDGKLANQVGALVYSTIVDPPWLEDEKKDLNFFQIAKIPNPTLPEHWHALVNTWELLSTDNSKDAKANDNMAGQCREQSMLMARGLHMHGIFADWRHIAARKKNDDNLYPAAANQKTGAVFAEQPNFTKSEDLNGTVYLLVFDFAHLDDNQIIPFVQWLQKDRRGDPPASQPNINGGEGCCCIPHNQRDPSEGHGYGRHDDAYANGTYYAANLNLITESKNGTDQRGDILMLKRLIYSVTDNPKEVICVMRWDKPISSVIAQPVERP